MRSVTVAGKQFQLTERAIEQWVAVRGDEVLVAAPAPRHVVAWLAEHGQQAQSVFRVPDSEQSIGGAAAL
jgi:hypothetical protein